MPMNRDECPRLLSLAVHELRSPITVVAGYLRMLLKTPGASLAEPQRRLVEEAEKSCGRLSGLVAELSDLANFTAGQQVIERREVALFPLLAEVAASVHEGADRDVRLEPSGPADGAVVQGDRIRLGHALTTLLTATLRERAEPGAVIARWGVQRDAVQPFAWLVVAAGDAHPSALDGFRPSDWTAFEPWRGGLGFRLVMANEIVAAHHGTLYSAGADGRAACALTLPLKEPPC
jgi:K+-sensing histidine kinase KdpD